MALSRLPLGPREIPDFLFVDHDMTKLTTPTSALLHNLHLRQRLPLPHQRNHRRHSHSQRARHQQRQRRQRYSRSALHP